MASHNAEEHGSVPVKVYGRGSIVEEPEVESVYFEIAAFLHARNLNEVSV